MSGKCDNCRSGALVVFWFNFSVVDRRGAAHGLGTAWRARGRDTRSCDSARFSVYGRYVSFCRNRWLRARRRLQVVFVFQTLFFPCTDRAVFVRAVTSTA